MMSTVTASTHDRVHHRHVMSFATTVTIGEASFAVQVSFTDTLLSPATDTPLILTSWTITSLKIFAL
jgi:hypothetical protein